MDAFHELDADVFALQETKLQEGQIEMDLPGYHQCWSYAERKGYSGTAVFCKEEPLQVIHEVGVPELDTEGRVVICEFEQYWLPMPKANLHGLTTAWPGMIGSVISAKAWRKACFPMVRREMQSLW